MEEHTFVTVNGLRVKIKMSYYIISFQVLEEPTTTTVGSKITYPCCIQYKTTHTILDFNCLLKY